MDQDNEPKIVAAPIGWLPEKEADLYCVCPGCGALIDCRDLGMVMEHAGELPHASAPKLN